jgi:hypothetical protein
MYKEFGALKGLLKLDPVSTDNAVFRLHYKVTTIILFAFTFVITCKQYVGDPIQCIPDKTSTHVMDTFCWVMSTYTLPHRQGGGESHPGVSSYTEGDEVKYHKYYQWVCFVLFIQGILFYTPRYLWKTWEGGRIKMLAGNLNVSIVSEDYKTDQKKNVLDYFATHLNTHNSYAIRFFICEALNLMNVVGQIYLLDYFLDGEFTSYGLDVIRFAEMDPDERVDPMSRIFPRVTKCTFHKYGHSGSLEIHDVLCILPLNVVNEKTFVFLWFWFLVLSLVTALALLYRAAVIVAPQIRLYILQSRCRLATRDQIRAIHRKCHIGDWFLLYRLSYNIDPLVYDELMVDLANRLEGKETV